MLTTILVQLQIADCLRDVFNVSTAGMRRSKRQQCHMSGTLDRCCQATLMPSTGTRASSRQDLAAIRDIALQAFHIFVVGHADFIRAESAHLPACDELAP